MYNFKKNNKVDKKIKIKNKVFNEKILKKFKKIKFVGVVY